MALQTCGVTIVAREREDGAWEVRCSGMHGHARPPALRLTPEERVRLDADEAGGGAGRGGGGAGARAVAAARPGQGAGSDGGTTWPPSTAWRASITPTWSRARWRRFCSCSRWHSTGESPDDSPDSRSSVVDTTHHIGASDEICLTSVLVPSVGHHVPVLLAYHRVHDAAMFAQIFARLFAEVPRVSGLVMDFSDAQLCGLAIVAGRRLECAQGDRNPWQSARELRRASAAAGAPRI